MLGKRTRRTRLSDSSYESGRNKKRLKDSPIRTEASYDMNLARSAANGVVHVITETVNWFNNLVVPRQPRKGA